VERLNKALETARAASTLHKLLDKFFTVQVIETVEAMKTCAHEELLDNRAYLLAITKLEKELDEYTNEYNLLAARSEHARNRS